MTDDAGMQDPGPESPPKSTPGTAPAPIDFERTRWSPGLIGFYVSCACVALGATIAAAGYMWFRSIPALVIGIVMTVVSTITCFTTLGAARRH